MVEFFIVTIEPMKRLTALTADPLMTFIVALVVATALLAVVMRSGSMPTPTEIERGGLAVGSSLPEISASAWINGPAPDDLEGNVVVVQGWFLNCPFCWTEAPELGDLARHYADADVRFVGLSPDDVSQYAAVEGFVRKNDLPYPVGYGATDTLLSFEAMYFPAVWVFDRGGKVVWNKAYDGYIPLETAIENALAAGD